MKKLLIGTVTLILATGLHAQNSPVSFPTDTRIRLLSKLAV